MSQTTDTQIAALINAVPVLAPGADLEDHVIKRLVQDLCQDIHSFDVIAKRYGLGDKGDLFAWLKDHPAVVTQVKKYKALNDSTASVKERIQVKAAHGLEDALIATTIAMTDPSVPVAQRIDYIKIHERLSGASTQPGKEGGAATGAQFVVNFHLSDRTETVTTTVVDAVPALAEQSED